ncbi:hypothetical protein BST97_12725 [Nonlabens spongiae]|uniref:Uncharacterized protein n=1 Tax=Nonlabens spongiae TaxID=331648 RepID=A0A1W6MMF4_9FLAO|nr:hypothetical protein [Nonlabens spongiae]ARN78785.1 hypothetical protein BST97_12725 [Nonlabens spongiae]
MILHKILKYLVILLSVIAAAFFVYTIASGDDAIEIDENGIQGSTVVPLMYLSYIMLAVIVAAVVLFLFVNLASNPKALKKSLLSVGIFLVVVGISYIVFADGSDAANNAIELDNGEYLSESGSKWIDVSIYTFYILAILAVGSIIWSGATKLVKK